MTSTEKASPRPWFVGDEVLDIRAAAPDDDDEFENYVLAEITLEGDDHTETDYANAALIIKAVNQHDTLTAALQTSQEIRGELLRSLKDILGIGPDLVEGLCRHCGRDFTVDTPSDLLCESDDCPGYQARAAIQRAEEA